MKKIVRTFLQNDEWKFLLVRHKWKDYWSLPGWHLKSKESIYKGLKREIKEELNLEIEFLWEKLWLELEHITEFPQPICTYKISQKTWVYFLNKDKIWKNKNSRRRNWWIWFFFKRRNFSYRSNSFTS